MIRPGLFRLTALGLFACTPLLAAGPRPASLAETPLEQCTPETALGWMYVESVDRQGDNAKEIIRETDQLQKIVDALPKSNRPVIELMTPQQAADFSRLSAQLVIHQYNNLAESRLQRDASVMGYAADAIQKLRNGEPDLKSKVDPKGEGASLVGLLRSVSQGAPVENKDSAWKTCTLDLAMLREQQQLLASVLKLSGSPEAAQFEQLRAKYHLTQLDPTKLPSPDREKAVWLLKAVSEPLARDAAAMSDWENLRRFAKVSWLRYTIFRDDILASAGDKNYDYDARLKKTYDGSDAVTQRTFDVWAVVDKNIPSEATQMAEQAAKIARQGSKSK